MQQTADALSYVHNFNIIHGCVNSTNLLLTDNYTRVKLADFGRASVERTSCHNGRNVELAMMTNEYMWTAPEVSVTIEAYSFVDQNRFLVFEQSLANCISRVDPKWKCAIEFTYSNTGVHRSRTQFKSM